MFRGNEIISDVIFSSGDIDLDGLPDILLPVSSR